MVRTEHLGSAEIKRAADLLKEGKLVAFPTETVYGLGACMFNSEAVLSIFKVKGRPCDNPLIAHISSLEQAEEIAQEIPDFFYRLASCFFPGPLTVILKRRPHVPSMISAGLDSIALRMPSHPLASRLIELVGEPLVAPSANLSGKPSSTQAKHVLEDFEGKIAAVIDGGKTAVGIESTVISLLGARPILLRPGVITKEVLENALGCPVEISSSHQGPVLSPGLKYRHYAPRAPVFIFHTAFDLSAHLAADLRAVPRMLLSRQLVDLPIPGLDQFALSAKEFYSLLRHADESQYCEILILCDEGLQKDAALMNRLTRAASE
jgi:L-threonylcarbamoyladenylate synthase